MCDLHRLPTGRYGDLMHDRRNGSSVARTHFSPLSCLAPKLRCSQAARSQRNNIMPRSSTAARPSSLASGGNLAGRGGCPDTLETDGQWCPMAHGNRLVSSFQSLPPLMRVSTVKKIDDASVSDWSAYSLGCFTGQTMAVGT